LTKYRKTNKPTNKKSEILCYNLYFNGVRFKKKKTGKKNFSLNLSGAEKV
jgi:hypothetical protein